MCGVAFAYAVTADPQTLSGRRALGPTAASPRDEANNARGGNMTELAGSLNIIFTEFYYWITVVIMFLIHVGFCTYEVGVSRRKNHMTTLMKNAMVIPVVTISFYLFGWWFYSSMVNGPGITGGLVNA